VSDAALLGRFVTERDEQAFAALVKRHGAMVHQVCWRILGNAAHVEDAFQATFLVLARKAATINPRGALPAWLHGVARRVALKSRSVHRRRHETGPLPEVPADGRPDPLAEISARELLTILDEEIQRLPERYRLPVLLCCLEGRSLEEVSRQLGWTFGSVKGRLERGRARLHDRLVRRGLTLAAALASVEVSRALAPASVIAGMAARTIPAAMAYGAGEASATVVSQSAAYLASRVVTAMAIPKLAITAVLVLTLAAVGAGIAVPGKPPEPTPPAQNVLPATEVSAAQKPLQQTPAAFWDQSDVPIDVQGQVLDPQGKPVAGAALYVGYSVSRIIRRALPEKPFEGQPRPESYPLRATTGANGRFQFRFATSELDARMLDDAHPAVMAIAAGYGPEWVELGPAVAGDLKLHLVDDLPLSGRVLDSDRRPVPGAKLVLQAIYSAPADELARYLKADNNGWAPRCWKGPLPKHSPAILTDADGRWRYVGMGRDRIAAFAIESPRVPRTMLNMATWPGKLTTRDLHLHGPEFDFLSPDVRTIRGAVLDRKSRKPIAGATVTIRPGNAVVRTGPDGRFEVLERREEVGYGLAALPESGYGYFAAQAFPHEEAGVAELTQDILLVRGIELSGKVTNDSTGKPPKSAVVEYYPLSSNPHGRRVPCTNFIPSSSAPVRPDGSYSLAVMPGPGVICVAASPREDYAAFSVPNKEWLGFLQQQRALFPDHELSDFDHIVAIPQGWGYPGALHINKYHIVVRINPPEETQSQTLNLPLLAAQPIQGTVLGPDSQPLIGVRVVGLSALRDVSELLEGPSFTISGLNPESSRQLVFLHQEKKLGKVVSVDGNAAQPLVVKLEPCGAIHGRIVDELGVPRPSAYVVLGEVAGPNFATTQADELGRFQLALVPGQMYSWGILQPLIKDFGKVRVGAGQILDLGDIALRTQIPRPRPPQPTPRAPR
jgi:RNA polymerase sigma factor (sigma-70 family)